MNKNLMQSHSNIYSINIDISNKKTNEKLPTLVHTFIANDVNEDISSLPKKFENFNGKFEISTKDRVLKKVEIKNGVVVSSKIFTSLNKNEYDCSVDGITSCADDEINDMNWVEYAFCAVGAPVCLAELYASCIYENCGNSWGPGDL